MCVHPQLEEPGALVTVEKKLSIFVHAADMGDRSHRAVTTIMISCIPVQTLPGCITHRFCFFRVNPQSFPFQATRSSPALRGTTAYELNTLRS